MTDEETAKEQRQYDAGCRAYSEIDKARVHLGTFRHLIEVYGDTPGFARAKRDLGLSDRLWQAYLDAANVFKDAKF